MTTIYIETGQKGRVSQETGFASLSHDELQSTIEQCRSLLASLLSGISNQWEATLLRTSERLRVRQRLDDQDIKTLNLVTALARKSKQDLNPNSRIHQSFVLDLLRLCSPGFALLCIISFAQRTLVRLKEDERLNLLKFLRDKEASYPSASILNTFATQYKLRELAGMRFQIGTH